MRSCPQPVLADEDLQLQGAQLVDGLLNRRLRLDPLALTVLQLVDGQRDAEQLLDAAAARHPEAGRAALEHALRRLLLMGLTGDLAAETRAQARRARGAGSPTLITLEGARFACQGSGGCCQGYELGPLSPADMERIEALDIAAAYPHLAGEPPFAVARWTETEKVFHLSRPNGRCLFLLPDRRCGLHAAFGEAAKPALCRLYPLRALLTIEGLRVYDGAECASFATSGRSGPALAELARRAPWAPGSFVLHHPLVHLAADVPCDYALYLPLQRAMDGLARAAGGCAPALQAMGHLLRDFTDALRGCALGPQGPQEAAQRALHDAPRWLHEAPGDADPALLRQVAADLQGAVQAERAAANPFRLAIYSDQYDVYCEDALALLAAAPPPDLPAAHPDCDEVLRRSLRAQWFGDGALVHGSAPAALVRMALAVLLTSLSARLQAARDGAAEVSHLSRAHASVLRTLRLDAAAATCLRYADHAGAITASAVAWLR